MLEGKYRAFEFGSPSNNYSTIVNISKFLISVFALIKYHYSTENKFVNNVPFFTRHLRAKFIPDLPTLA